MSSVGFLAVSHHHFGHLRKLQSDLDCSSSGGSGKDIAGNSSSLRKTGFWVAVKELNLRYHNMDI